MTEPAAGWRAKQFTLVRGGVVLGTVSVDGSDQPWWLGTLQPSASYDDVRPLFERLEAVLDVEGFGEEAEAVVSEIMAPGMVMRTVDGSETHAVEGISIAGVEVTWR